MKGILLLGVCGAVLGYSAAVREPVIGRGVNENTCAISGRTVSFKSTDAQIFVAFLASGVRQGESLRMDWVSPAGEVVSSAPYEGLPRAASLCFVSHLPVAGFGPGSQPGRWQLRIFVNQQLVTATPFDIIADGTPGAGRLESITRTSTLDGEAEFTVEGSSLSAGSVVHIAQLAGRDWRYLHAALPLESTGTRLRIRIPALAVGEYLAVIRDEQDRVSNSLRFVIASRESYKLPLPAGEPWRVTQGPYGGFSHYGQALHAYDIAPVKGRCLVAMRGGVVHAYDRGFGQSHASRTFGNYITIDHGDGEYSHYAHLASRSFVVRTGQRVEQGQALAIVGNSGYTFPWGGGHHVHVHVTRSFSISSQSIPFEFEDMRQGSRFRGIVVSTNRSPHCDCSKPGPNFPGGGSNVIFSAVGGGGAQARPMRAGTKVETSAVGVDAWWNHFVTVSPGARAIDVRLVWDAADADLDLHLVSPSGRHYGWYGEVTGYSGQDGNPEQFEIPNPEPGQWRVSVQGRRGAGPDGLIHFRLETFTSAASVARRR
jgi:murein DD-endopeptidase MepM/ murein hydrolase activator NlpD